MPRRIPIAGRRRTLILRAGVLAVATAIPGLPMLAQAGARIETAQAEVPEAEGADPAKPITPKRRPPQAKPAAPKASPAKAAPSQPEAARSEGAKTDAAKPGAPAPAPPATLAAAAAAGANTAALNVSAKLIQNGVGACASTIDAEAVPSMVGVSESNTVSFWSNVEPRDKHATSVVIGQRYGSNPAVPYGVTSLVSSPTPSGSCDVTVVQVVSSPLPCGKVRETLARGGKLLGELAGLPLMQSGDGQTLLMPTATNTCVLVGFHAKFGN